MQNEPRNTSPENTSRARSPTMWVIGVALVGAAIGLALLGLNPEVTTPHNPAITSTPNSEGKASN